MESGGHRGDQRITSVRHQADPESDRTRGVEQVALALLPYLDRDCSSPVLPPVPCDFSRRIRNTKFSNLYDVFLLCLPRAYHRLYGYCR